MPTVSVILTSYNHEKYLEECLDGILMQQCNFSFNIIVGEDCSTDNSRELLLSYRNKYPGKFKLLLHEKNIGAVENQNAVFAACAGMALLWLAVAGSMNFPQRRAVAVATQST